MARKKRKKDFGSFTVTQVKTKTGTKAKIKRKPKNYDKK